jgi:hypothetical protein
MKSGIMVVVALSCVALGIFASCQESLPPYNDPADVLKGSVRGRYVFSATANAVRFDFTVVNTFDETFQDRGILRGEIVLTLRRKPTVHKALSLGPSNLTEGNFVFSTQVLTMDPGDTIRLTATWDYTDDSYRDLRDSEFVYIQDPGCPFRNISLEEVFDVRGSLMVFDKVEEVSAVPVEFGFCHVDRWVAPQVCTSILPEEACKVLSR